MHCPICHRKNPAGAKHCRHCGKELPDWKSRVRSFIDDELVVPSFYWGFLGLSFLLGFLGGVTMMYDGEKAQLTAEKRAQQVLIEKRAQQALVESLPPEWKSAYYALRRMDSYSTRCDALVQFSEKESLGSLSPEQIALLMDLFTNAAEGWKKDAFATLSKFIVAGPEAATAP